MGKKGRLLVANFPNLAYPCDRCGALIQKGKLCDHCAKGIQDDLSRFEQEKRRKEEQRKNTYYFKNF
jgi:hypothetical protein